MTIEEKKMAAPNQLRIKASESGPTEVLVSDAQGQVYDISGKFRKNSGETTPSGFSNHIEAEENSTNIVIEFVAIEKELLYTLTPQAARSLSALSD